MIKIYEFKLNLENFKRHLKSRISNFLLHNFFQNLQLSPHNFQIDSYKFQKITNWPRYFKTSQFGPQKFQNYKVAPNCF